jgi:hypothetical protein
MTTYLVSYNVMKDWLGRRRIADSEHLDIKYDDIVELIRKIIRAVPVDSAWYLTRYPGVGKAVESGVFRSAADHFVRHGYFEGTVPSQYHPDDKRALPRFATIKSMLTVVPVRGGLRVHISRDELFRIVRSLLVAVPLDENWYKERYKGVADAIAAKKVRSAFAHFVEHGYFENRMPFHMQVDEEWYCEHYPYVRALIANGVVGSADEHFLRFGYSQGCLPADL